MIISTNVLNKAVNLVARHAEFLRDRFHRSLPVGSGIDKFAVTGDDGRIGGVRGSSFGNTVDREDDLAADRIGLETLYQYRERRGRDLLVQFGQLARD